MEFFLPVLLLLLLVVLLEENRESLLSSLLVVVLLLPSTTTTAVAAEELLPLGCCCWRDRGCILDDNVIIPTSLDGSSSPAGTAWRVAPPAVRLAWYEL